MLRDKIAKQRREKICPTTSSHNDKGGGNGTAANQSSSVYFSDTYNTKTLNFAGSAEHDVTVLTASGKNNEAIINEVEKDVNKSGAQFCDNYNTNAEGGVIETAFLTESSFQAALTVPLVDYAVRNDSTRFASCVLHLLFYLICTCACACVTL